MSAIEVFRKYNSKYESKKHRESVYRDLEFLHRNGFLSKKYDEKKKQIIYSLRVKEITINVATGKIITKRIKMNLKTKLLFTGSLFSWLMVFLSWRFAHPVEIMLDWLLLALGLSVLVGIIQYRQKTKRHIADLSVSVARWKKSILQK